MKYRKTNVQKWADDIHMSMSPEQKLIFDWLNTNPFTKMCGIHPISFPTMAIQIGIVEQNVISAFEAMCKQFPNVVAFDPITNEYFMPSWLRENAASSSPKIVRPICDQIKAVRSKTLLNLLNERTPSGKREIKKTIQNRLRSLSQVQNLQKTRATSEVFEYQPLVIPLAEELKNLRTKELKNYKKGEFSNENIDRFQDEIELNPAQKSNGEIGGKREVFSSVKGLRKKIGPKHYELLNEIAKDESIYQTLRSFYPLRKFEVLTDWLEYKKEIRKGYRSERGLKQLVKTFTDYTYLELLDALNASLSNEWQSINPKINVRERKATTHTNDNNLSAIFSKLQNKRAV